MVVKIEEKGQKEGKTWRIDHGFLELNILPYASDGREAAQRSRGHCWDDSDLDDSVLKRNGESKDGNMEQKSGRLKINIEFLRYRGLSHLCTYHSTKYWIDAEGAQWGLLWIFDWLAD